MIVTQRLKIAPLSDEEMERLIALEPDPELRLRETGEAVGDCASRAYLLPGLWKSATGCTPPFRGGVS